MQITWLLVGYLAGAVGAVACYKPRAPHREVFVEGLWRAWMVGFFLMFAFPVTGLVSILTEDFSPWIHLIATGVTLAGSAFLIGRWASRQ